jgi:hypothetical protein
MVESWRCSHDADVLYMCSCTAYTHIDGHEVIELMHDLIECTRYGLVLSH